MLTSSFQIEVNKTAIELIAANPDQPGRVQLVVKNEGIVPVYLGPSSAVKASTGISLAAGEQLNWVMQHNRLEGMYRGALWAIAVGFILDQSKLDIDQLGRVALPVPVHVFEMVWVV